MIKIAEFTIGFQDTRKKIQEEISKELYSWRRKIKQYKTGLKIVSDDLYRMNEDDALFQEIIAFAEKFPEEIDMMIYQRELEYESKEVEDAIAFVPAFTKHWCEEYYDTATEYEECRYCHVCMNLKSEKTYVMPRGYIKTHKDDYGVLKMDTADTRWMVLPELYKKLIEEGIEEKYFRPIYSKKKVILAYELYSDNILPKESYIDGNYQIKSQCNICKSRNYEINTQQHTYVDKFLTKNAKKNLRSVNKTAEYYAYHPQILISKELHDMIKKYDPTAQFYPVYKNDEIK